MDRELSQLLLRRGEILGRIRRQRVDIAEFAGQLAPALGWAERGLSLFGQVRQHPYVVTGVAAFVLWRRRGLSGVVKSGWRMWRGLRLFAALRKTLIARLMPD